MVADKCKNDEKKEQDRMKNMMARTYAAAGVMQAVKGMECGGRDCALCKIHADVCMNTAVLSCAAALALTTDPSVLERINKFFHEIVKENPNLKPPV